MLSSTQCQLKLSAIATALIEALGTLPALASASGLAAPSYRLDTIPEQNGVTPTYAFAINNLGVAVGRAEVKGDDALSVFKYENGTVTLLKGSRAGYVGGINDAGEVSGTVSSGGQFTAAMWTAAGELQLVGPVRSAGGAINSKHQVVGYAEVGGQDHAALFSGGTFTDLHGLGQYSHATSVNSNGKVAGYFVDASGQYHGFAWQSGVMREVCKYDGAIYTLARAVNHKGQVLCEVDTADKRDIALIEDDDGVQHLIPGVRGNGLLPNSMNNFGENTGRAYPRKAPYYSTGSKTYYLINLVTVNAGDWAKLQYASDINRGGQIVGWGRSSSGTQRAYVATPLSVR